MNKQSIAAVLICAALVTSPASAKDMDGEHAVFGLGATQCSDYLGARRAGGSAQKSYADWMLAYVSAFNLIVPNTYNLFGNATLDASLQWLDDFCRGDQRTLFINAVASLSERLYPARANYAPNKDTRAKWARKVITGEDKQ